MRQVVQLPVISETSAVGVDNYVYNLDRSAAALCPRSAEGRSGVDNRKILFFKSATYLHDVKYFGRMKRMCISAHAVHKYPFSRLQALFQPPLR